MVLFRLRRKTIHAPCVRSRLFSKEITASHTKKSGKHRRVCVLVCVSFIIPTQEQEVQTKYIIDIIEPKKKEKAKRSQCSGKLGS
jgi:hypothetical protein